MRLSVRKDDPGYDPRAFGARVYLDGKEITHCFTADEERGYALVYVLNENGQPFIDPGRREPRWTALYGDVVIKPAD